MDSRFRGNDIVLWHVAEIIVRNKYADLCKSVLAILITTCNHTFSRRPGSSAGAPNRTRNGRRGSCISKAAVPEVLDMSPNLHIARFVQKLQRFRTGPHVHNPYAVPQERTDSAIRRANLRRYLEQYLEVQPRVMLIGEAPGYRGCRVTGTPFTNLRILTKGVDGLPLFGIRNGFQSPTATRLPPAELSATILWNALAGVRNLPLVWNAFPFHPWKPQNPWSNRKPSRKELQQGVAFLRILRDIYDIRTLVAVGRSAEFSLQSMGEPHQAIRHPAYGGKKEFLRGLTRIVDAPSFPSP